jgi:hypothetical protein
MQSYVLLKESNHQGSMGDPRRQNQPSEAINQIQESKISFPQMTTRFHMNKSSILSNQEAKSLGKDLAELGKGSL